MLRAAGVFLRFGFVEFGQCQFPFGGWHSAMPNGFEKVGDVSYFVSLLPVAKVGLV